MKSSSCDLPFSSKPLFVKLNKKDDLLDHALRDDEEEPSPPISRQSAPILVPYDHRLYNWMEFSRRGEVGAGSGSGRLVPHVQWSLEVRFPK
jgi:hypothetical protein